MSYINGSDRLELYLAVCDDKTSKLAFGSLYSNDFLGKRFLLGHVPLCSSFKAELHGGILHR